MAIQNAGLYALAHDFGVMPGKYANKIRPIFNKTAVEIKKGMQKDFQGSQHFKQVGRSIDYEVEIGAHGLSVEIGPNAETNAAAPLAGIAYFGGSNGGGGSVRDPIFHARDQGAKMVGFLAMAAEGLL